MFPRAFTKVKEGRTINLTIAGKAQDILIPDLNSLSLRNGKLNITGVQMTRMGMPELCPITAMARYLSRFWFLLPR